MSVGRLLTLGLGTPFSDAGFLVTLGLNTSGVTPPSEPERSGAGGGNYKKKEKRKKFILPNGDVVWATRSEVEYNIALWRELNPGAYVEEPVKPVAKPKIVFSGKEASADLIEFEPIEKPQRAMRVSGMRFTPEHPLYTEILTSVKKRLDDDEDDDWTVLMEAF